MMKKKNRSGFRSGNFDIDGKENMSFTMGKPLKENMKIGDNLDLTKNRSREDSS